MKGFRPPKPTGSTPKARFDIWVYETLTRLNFIDSATVKFNQRTNCISADAVVKASDGTPQAIQIKQFNVIQIFGDYVFTSQGIRIAKPYKLRNSLLHETIYGTNIVYSYPHNKSNDGLYGIYRTATIPSGGGSENQGVVPQYLLSDPIWAIQVPTGVVTEASDTLPVNTPVTWLDLNVDGRAWCRFSNQSF